MNKLSPNVVASMIKDAYYLRKLPENYYDAVRIQKVFLKKHIIRSRM